jgi:putative transposase
MATLPQRRSIRLKGYDYSQAGAYFVTLCTYQQHCLFGAVSAGTVQLNEFGRIASDEWSKSTDVRQEIELDAVVVMPNHLHGIVWIINPDEQTTPVGAHGRAPLQRNKLWRPPKSLGSFIAGYKAAATQQINWLRHTPGAPVWQRNYYEHIIRTERALTAIRQYIFQNPLRWELDRYNPAARGPDPQARELWNLLQQETK